MNALRAIYFPLSIPRRNRAAKWHCIRSYSAMKTEPGYGGVKINRCIFPAPHPAAAGKKIFCFSDLHYRRKNEKLLRSLLRLVKAVSPDYLVSLGDLTADGSDIPALEDALSRLGAFSIPKLAIPGNWERGKFWIPLHRWERMYRERGWIWLRNELFADEACCFYGTDDLATGYPRLPETPLSPERAALLLTHRPDTVIALDRGNKLKDFDFALCGHTHGGQIRLPLFGPVYASSRYGCRFAAGIFRRRKINTRMIVNTGLNELSIPFRFNCRREILLLEFSAAETSGAALK